MLENYLDIPFYVVHYLNIPKEKYKTHTTHNTLYFSQHKRPLMKNTTPHTKSLTNS